MESIETSNSNRPEPPAGWQPERAFASPEHLELLNQSRDGCQPDKVRQQAKTDLIRANWGLITSWTRRFAGTSFEDDVIQAGAWALSRSIDGFDPGAGVRFSTYATQAIRGAVSREAGEHLSPIRLPIGVRWSISRAKRVAGSLEARLNQPPTDRDLCDALGWDPASLEELRSQDYLVRSVASLSADLGRRRQPGSVRELASLIPDANGSNPEDEVLSGELRQLIRFSCNRLPERQGRFINRAYGLDGRPEQPAKSIAADWGMKKGNIAIRSVSARAHQTLAYILPRLADPDPVDRQLASRLGLPLDSVVWRRRFVGLLKDFAPAAAGRQPPDSCDWLASRLVGLDRALKGLDPRDREIIVLRAGLGPEWPHSCWEISQRLDAHPASIYNISQRGCRQTMTWLGLTPPDSRARIDLDRDQPEAGAGQLLSQLSDCQTAGPAVRGATLGRW